ncbi:MAG: alpha/beta fold hydrolase [Acidimicrobiales bacterium]
MCELALRRTACLAALTVAGALATVGCSTQSTSTDEGRLSPGQAVDVTYCNGQTARITEPTTSARSPAVIYLHGGSWIGGDNTSGGFIINSIGPALNAKGFVVAAVNYRLGPQAPWPAQIVDAKCAVRYLRAHADTFDIDPAEIGIWGHSAGGHLASLVGTAGPSAGWNTGAYPDESSRVQAVADLAGPSDLVTLDNEGIPGTVKANFKSLLKDVPESQLTAELAAASPVTYVSRGDPPFLIVHSDDDLFVPLAQSEELAQALEGADVPVTLVVVHGGGHSLDQPGGRPDPKQIEELVVKFFTTELRPRG